MINFDKFFEYLYMQSPAICQVFREACNKKLFELSNGDAEKWLDAINNLPKILPSQISLNSDAVGIGSSSDIDDAQRTVIKDELMKFHPWRKGPFDIFGILIDTEWRSNLKWDRLIGKIKPLKDKMVLDVGSGNGYYDLRMLGCDAKAVIGIDPFILYVMQFAAINKYIQTAKAAVLPLGIEDLPKNLGLFDTIFSMGVLYHRKEPIEHINMLAGMLKTEGELVLETLIVCDACGQLLIPNGRYAKMRNVWSIPSIDMLKQWLADGGFCNINVRDICQTTTFEQRKTAWMHFESLGDFLDNTNPDLTIEGHPAPIRAVITAEKKSGR